MSKRGFSLLEVIISCALFGALTTLIFVFFRFGTHAFHSANERTGLQMDAIRCMESLSKELKRSSEISIASVNDASRTINADTGETVHRDAISFTSLKNWADRTNSENFDLETGAPLWNRYYIFYATKEPEGKFVRIKIDPSVPPNGAAPLTETALGKLIYDDPTTNKYESKTPSYATLARSVYNFNIKQTSQDSYSISLKLRSVHVVESTEPGERRLYDYYELISRLTPENSLRTNN